MRSVAALLALAAVAGADDAPLREPRVWRGVVEIRATSKSPPQGKGREEQTERLEFWMVTEPPKQTLVRARLPFDSREALGEYEVALDLSEPGRRDGETVAIEGRGAGRLHGRVGGWVEPETGAYSFAVQVEPTTLVAKTTLSGVENGRFQTFTTVERRRAFLASMEAEGKLESEGRAFSGSRSWTDRSGRLAREVSLAWRVRRVDPVVQGRVVDRAGAPLEGVRVLARTTNRERVALRQPPFLLEGTTDAEGRFRIDAWHATWGVEVCGLERADGERVLLVAGRDLPDGVEVRFEKVPDLEIALDVYRLDRLPFADLFRGRFSGDVKAYLAYVAERATREQLEAASAR
ncbi:MAG: carboxypeptidase-like regulatory domain-containing protein [Planctomycetota bacterium]